MKFFNSQYSLGFSSTKSGLFLFYKIMPIENIFTLNDNQNGGTETFEIRNAKIEGGVVFKDYFSGKYVHLDVKETEKLIAFLENCIEEHENLFK